LQGHHQSPCQIVQTSDIPGRNSKDSLSYRKRDAEPSIGTVKTIERKSWLSPQVYTPIGRLAYSPDIFLEFPQVTAVHFRKVVCQNCQGDGTNEPATVGKAEITRKSGVAMRYSAASGAISVR
jgi:hypothetical protein